jgi:hypothetical protein
VGRVRLFIFAFPVPSFCLEHASSTVVCTQLFHYLHGKFDLRDCEYDEPGDARFLVVLVYSGNWNFAPSVEIRRKSSSMPQSKNVTLIIGFCIFDSSFEFLIH